MNGITEISNYNRIDKDTMVCSKTEFTQTTDKPDGTILMVIDEGTHTVDGYYIAYKGYWNEL